MLLRLLRLFKALQQYFAQNLGNRTVINRAPTATDWQAAREVVSVLDDAALNSHRADPGWGPRVRGQGDQRHGSAAQVVEP